MLFGKPRSSYDWELSRFCSRIGYRVRGGAGKLLKYFRDQHPGTVVSYANIMWSDGGLYDSLGFTLKHVTKPLPWYYKNNCLFHRSMFNRVGISKILGLWIKDLRVALTFKTGYSLFVELFNHLQGDCYVRIQNYS